jgi:serine/threonine protein kinase
LATPLAQLEGKYEILEKIREGGMGAVYKVRHRLLEEVRVVKVMRPHLADDEVLQARFLREAKVAVKLRHPNLAQIYDFTVDDSGFAYLVMEFIDGLNLQEVIKVLEKPGLGLVLEIARQSIEALGYLHRKRIIHRDVSPDNLLLTRDDEGALQVKLIDLGIAKVRGGDDSLTSEGTFLGKVRYSSPEHFKTQEGSDVNAASDLYSFGVVFYEMLTGTYPIQGTSVASLISGHLMHPPLAFEESDPEGRVPEDLRTVVRKALDKDPKKRFGSSTSFIKALKPWFEEHPLEENEFEAIFDLPTLTTHKIRTIKPGSTQSRIDRSFGLSTTPPPDDSSNGDNELETSGTVETGSAGREKTPGKEGSQEAQIRALLVGATKLAEAEHFEEARMQLTSVLELEAENAEAQRLLKEVDESDVELQNKRLDAAESVRLLVRAESFEQAATQLRKAVKEFGKAAIFDEVDRDIKAASEAYQERLAVIEDRVLKIDRLIIAGRLESAMRMIGATAKELGDFDQASALRTRIEETQAATEGAVKRAEALLEQALEHAGGNTFSKANDVLDEARALQADHPQIADLVSDAETEVRRRIEAHRRQMAIDNVIQSIERQLDTGSTEEAHRELGVAHRLYGESHVLGELAAKIDARERELRSEEIAKLVKSSQKKKRAPDDAIADLEAVLSIDPHCEEAHRLLIETKAARKCTTEAKLAKECKAALATIDELIAAGEPARALEMLNATVEEVGDFRVARDLRRTLEKQA